MLGVRRTAGDVAINPRDTQAKRCMYGIVVSMDEIMNSSRMLPVRFEYLFGNRLNHKPKRIRKLLLHRREIDKFAAKAEERGFTLVPLRMYFKGGIAKVEIAIAKGKQTHDKRESLKKADAKREIDRAMSASKRKKN